MIAIKDISKNYGEVKALKKTNLIVEQGEIFGLLGPDGAGKTTLLRLISTLLLPDTGTITINSIDVVKNYTKIRHILGYMPGKFSLYQDLTILENLEFFATIFGTTIEANYDLIKDIYSQIEPFKNRRAGKLSGGMKQKLALCCALIHKPEVLILDEPSTGVDPVSRKEFWDILSKLKKLGITIMVSTPYMDEAMRCDRVGLMIDGEIIEIDTPSNIVLNFKTSIFAAKANNMFDLLNDIRNFKDTDTCYTFGEYLHIILKPNVDYKDIQTWLKSKEYLNLEFNKIEPTIEDCFMHKIEKMQKNG